MKNIKNLVGIKIVPLEITAGTTVDGFGLTLLTLTCTFLGKICYESISRSLFHFGVHNYRCRGGHERYITLILFGKYWKLHTWVITEIKQECKWCGDTCQTKEHFEDGEAFCSADCKEDNKY